MQTYGLEQWNGEDESLHMTVNGNMALHQRALDVYAYMEWKIYII